MKAENKSHRYYWNKNFNNKDVVASSDDYQLNIARTKGGEVIEDEIWINTLKYISNLLEIDKSKSVLELCCGNGVIIGELASFCQSAMGVDYSAVLLSQLEKKYKRDNLSIKHSDVLDVKIGDAKFDCIIIYFSLQHFSEKETLQLIRKAINLLKLNGKILIGDIPDIAKKWEYINKPEYQIDYFSRVLDVRPKIGHWFQKEFFLAMNSFFANVTIGVVEQPDWQINSDHCFDVLICKNGEK